jgi:hypothetical protein
MMSDTNDAPREPEPAPAGGEQDHHGQDGGRETLTVGEAQREGSLGAGATQDLPAMSQNNATDEDKISGIIAQTRQDLPGESLERIGDVLRQRFADAGVEVADDRLAELARAVGGA